MRRPAFTATHYPPFHSYGYEQQSLSCGAAGRSRDATTYRDDMSPVGAGGAGTEAPDVTRSDPYEWWSRNTWALRGLYGAVFLGRGRGFRRRSVAALELTPGDSVLELGCGSGNSFTSLRSAVGPDGCVVGIDYSEGMVRRATERVDAAGWDNVHVVRGDATTPAVAPGAFDGVYAAMSLSAMPDPAAAVEAAAASLGNGGRLAVLDARPFQRAPLSVLNPVMKPTFELLTDWRPAVNIPGAIESAFEEAAVRDHHFGSIYVATGVGPRSAGSE